MTVSNPIELLLKPTDLSTSKTVYFEYQCTNEELVVLGNLLQVDKLSSLSFKITIKHTHGPNFKLLAFTDSTVHQTCIISLKPIKTKLNFTIERLYSVQKKQKDKTKLIYNILENEIEFIDKKLNLGDVILEGLSLEIPDYPRRKNVKFRGVSVTKNGVQPIHQTLNNPFGALKDLFE